MTGPTLAAIRQRLKAMKAALEIASHEQTHHCLNPVAVRQIVVDANTLLARLAAVEQHIGAHHAMPCATCDVKTATIADLQAKLAACREALKEWMRLVNQYEIAPHHSSDGKDFDAVVEQTDKALAQEGEG